MDASDMRGQVNARVIIFLPSFCVPWMKDVIVLQADLYVIVAAFSCALQRMVLSLMTPLSFFPPHSLSSALDVPRDSTPTFSCFATRSKRQRHTHGRHERQRKRKERRESLFFHWPLLPFPRRKEQNRRKRKNSQFEKHTKRRKRTIKMMDHLVILCLDFLFLSFVSTFCRSFAGSSFSRVSFPCDCEHHLSMPGICDADTHSGL